MPFLLLSAFLLLLAFPLTGSSMAVWILLFSQGALLAGQIARKQVTGAGGFIFMSLLFFGMRPLYVLIENDKALLQRYGLSGSMEDITSSMWWATLAIWCFALGAIVAPVALRRFIQVRKRRNATHCSMPDVSQKTVSILLAAQIVTLPIIGALAAYGRSLYGSAVGAYAYDLPIPLQAIHVFAVVVFVERWVRRRNMASAALLALSSCLFLYFTWVMRDISMFRGFYLSGVMIAGIAAIQTLKGRAGYAWLLVPIVGLQPFFVYLGEDRYKKNDQLAQSDVIEEVFSEESIGETYWKFYESKGDMNIFDTFVAAKQSEPKWYPFIWSWAYVPLHLVPRAVWPGKPQKGVTMDLAFLRKLPTSPGIAGFFLVDGGFIWMLLCMFVLGFLLSSLDCRVLTMPRGYLQSCLLGIITVNGMFLSRVLLWQYFYGVLYAAVPCLLLAWFVNRHAQGRRRAVPVGAYSHSRVGPQTAG